MEKPEYTELSGLKGYIMYLIDVPHKGVYPFSIRPAYLEYSPVWPMIPEVRNHYLKVFPFLRSLLLAAKAELLPDLGIDELLPEDWLEEMTKQLADDGNEKIILSWEDLLYIYMSLHMVNSLLVSDYDQDISELLLHYVNADNKLKTPKAFRDHMIKYNNAQIRLMCPYYSYVRSFRVENYQLAKWVSRLHK